MTSHITDKYDSNFDNLVDKENFLILINGKPFSYKLLLIKQSLVNFRIFMRKFSLSSSVFNIFNLFSIKQVIYIMRHLQIDIQVKQLLLDVLIDYFSPNQQNFNVYIHDLINECLTLLSLKLNESFDNSLFKLVTLGLKNLSFDTTFDQTIPLFKVKLIDLITTHLKSADNLHRLLDQLEIVITFLKSNLANETNKVVIDFINELLDSDDHFLIKKCNEYVLVSDTDSAGSSIEAIVDLKESIFDFYRLLYDSLKRKVEICLRTNNKNLPKFGYESLINNETFIGECELMSLTETEAFMRRPCVKFLASYRSYSLSKWALLEQSAEFKFSLWNGCNYFSYFLLNEFDWQVQLYCLEYYEHLFGLMSQLLDSNGHLSLLHSVSPSSTQQEILDFTEHSVIEIVCKWSECFKSLVNTIDDFDQHVVQSAVSLLIKLKQNAKLVAILSDLYGSNSSNSLEKKTITSYTTSLRARLSAKNGKLAVGTLDEINNNLQSESLDEDKIKIFLNSISVESLQAKLDESRQTSDIYTRNPLTILDDIIGSYQFDLDEEKAVDCY